jgi:hypothetical protein
MFKERLMPRSVNIFILELETETSSLRALHEREAYALITENNFSYGEVGRLTADQALRVVDWSLLCRRSVLRYRGRLKRDIDDEL